MALEGEKIGVKDIRPTCGRGGLGGGYWRDFHCEPRDKLLQSVEVDQGLDLVGTDTLVEEYEYLCNETNILDRLFKAYDFYRNPEVGQSRRDCLWEVCADQLNRATKGSSFTVDEVRNKCLNWLRANQHFPMGPDCSLPTTATTSMGNDDDDESDRGIRCTLGEYVKARWGLEWSAWVDLKERDSCDVLCLWAVAECFSCIIYVCSKTFPYPDFFCKFGQAGPSLLVAHWQKKRHFFRSLIPKAQWEELYARVKQERGIAKMNHRLYAGLLRYQDRAEDAVEHCKMEIQNCPDSLVGHHTWAIVLSDNFKSEEAMQHYLAQLLINPGHPHSYNGVGTTLHDMRRYEEAIFFYKMQLIFNPMNKYSHLNMSLAYARLKKYTEAEREHRIQLVLHPTDRNTCDYFLELLNEMKKPQIGVDFFSALVKKEPWRNDWRVNLARAYVCVKEFGKAAEQLEMVLKTNRDDSRALIGLAELFERNGYYQRSLKLLQRLVEIFPSHARVRSFLGDVQIKLGQFDEANKILEEQIKLFPNDSEAYARMAELNAQKGDTEAAIALYKKARSVDPTDSSSLFNIGLCYLDLEDFVQARAYFQQHLAENPNDPMSLLEVANTYYASGELEPSVRYYRAVLESKPDHHDCRAWLASTLAECGRRQEAIVEFEYLVKETGKLGFHYNISVLYLGLADQAQDKEQAKEYRQKAELHTQLETGVGRQYVEQFYARINNPADFAEDAPMEVVTEANALTPANAWLLREANLPTGTRHWTPAVHQFCSRLAKSQVMTLLLMLHRAEKTAGYPFPREIKHRIIAEMLAPPSEAFVRSLVGPTVAEELRDSRASGCFRPMPTGETVESVVVKCEAAGIKVLHSFCLFWPLVPVKGVSSGMPITQLPAEANPASFEKALYLTCATMAELRSVGLLPLFQRCHMLRLSPAELVHVPYVSTHLDKIALEPFSQVVAMYCQSLQNRQMCEAVLALAGEADCMPALLTAVSYGLGDETAVKSAIRVLLQDAKNGNTVSCYNAVLVICLLMVKLTPDAKEWAMHLEGNSEFAVVLQISVAALLEAKPCGQMLNFLGLLLMEVASQDFGEDPGGWVEELLGWAKSCFSTLVAKAPAHPTALYSLGCVHMLQQGDLKEGLDIFERSCQRHPKLGHIEAADILLALGRPKEAFHHFELQVSVDAFSAYGRYAMLLQRQEERNQKAGKPTTGAELRRAVDEIRRFWEAHQQLTMDRAALDQQRFVNAFDEFLTWEAGLPLEPVEQGPPPRVDFVPRVPETPFGVADDFEQQFLL